MSVIDHEFWMYHKILDIFYDAHVTLYLSFYECFKKRDDFLRVVTFFERDEDRMVEVASSVIFRTLLGGLREWSNSVWTVCWWSKVKEYAINVWDNGSIPHLWPGLQKSTMSKIAKFFQLCYAITHVLIMLTKQNLHHNCRNSWRIF